MNYTAGLTVGEVWETLEKASEAGIHFRALDPFIPVRATISIPSRRLGIQIQVAEDLAIDPGQLKGSSQIAIEASTDDHGTLVRLELIDPNAEDLFKRVCEDIVPRALGQKSDSAAALMIVRRFATWQRFLKASSGRGLSNEKQIGLFGELRTLEHLLLVHTDAFRAVRSWTGPAGAPQDFQIDGVGIEVKTIVHSEPQTLRIDGERQLDNFGLGALVVAHHRVLKHQDAGESLPTVVDRMRAHLESDEGPVDTFDDRLLSYGYADDEAHLYEASGFTVRETKYYKVGAGFPRITEENLLPGVGGVRYSVDASACIRFEIQEDTVVRWFSDPPTVTDPAAANESMQVEYKQTAWTPVGPVENDQHRSSVSRALKASIIKTVVAFLNSEGGELVIGVDDESRKVTGIEADLTSRGRAPDDVDFYEQEIVALLLAGVDPTVHSHIRIEIKSHDGTLACHIRVKPSPTPRFGHPPAEPNEKSRPVFWVRAGNTTQQLDGEEIIAYIQNHWA